MKIKVITVCALLVLSNSASATDINNVATPDPVEPYFKTETHSYHGPTDTNTTITSVYGNGGSVGGYVGGTTVSGNSAGSSSTTGVAGVSIRIGGGSSKDAKRGIHDSQK